MSYLNDCFFTSNGGRFPSLSLLSLASPLIGMVMELMLSCSPLMLPKMALDKSVMSVLFTTLSLFTSQA